MLQKITVKLLINQNFLGLRRLTQANMRLQGDISEDPVFPKVKIWNIKTNFKADACAVVILININIALPYRWFFPRGNFARNVMETLKVCIIQIKLILIVCPAPTPIYFSLPTNSCHSCHFNQRLELMGRVWPSAGPRLPQAALLPEQASAAGVRSLPEWLQICVKVWHLSANILLNAFPFPGPQW